MRRLLPPRPDRLPGGRALRQLWQRREPAQDGTLVLHPEPQREGRTGAPVHDRRRLLLIDLKLALVAQPVLAQEASQPLGGHLVGEGQGQ